ncbi:MAG: SpoIVB peptidase [Clostridia bacterium]|nr:SpoIVB peptidase [Clostridia bacterium]
MKFLKNFFLIIVLSIIFVYITNISAIPEKLILFQNEEYKLNLLNGIKSAETNEKNEIKTDIIGNIKLKLKALGIIPVKDISVSVVPEKLVIPVGQTLGVKLYSKGVLIVGKSVVEGIDGNDYEPYVGTNIEIGDIILEINGIKTEKIEDLKKIVEESNGRALTVKYLKNEQILEDDIIPIKSIDGNDYKIGLWVRDGAMGIGTVSFVDAETGKFAALGHGVSDADTKNKIILDSGTLNEAKIVSVTKGKKDDPGEILGVIDSGEIIGNVNKNSNIGIYGNLTEKKLKELNTNDAVKVASRNEIEIGKATILCTVEEGGAEEFEIEIQKKYLDKSSNSKCMIIKVTDKELLEKTGGIIQGMSGSPILQNGKLIGAVTHVFVNDATRGYAVFADMMLEEMYS